MTRLGDSLADGIWQWAIVAVIGAFLAYKAPLWVLAPAGHAGDLDALHAWAAAQGPWVDLGAKALRLVGGLLLIRGAAACLEVILVVGTKILGHVSAALTGGAVAVAVLTGRLLARVFGVLLQAALLPLRLVLWGTFKPILEELELWHLWRTEYRADFARYRDFRRFYEALRNGADPNDLGGDEPGAADRFAWAVERLGLSEGFSKAEFEKAYRACIREVHPDLVGPNDAAQEVNAAAEIIREEMGW